MLTVKHSNCPYGMEEYCEFPYSCEECRKREKEWADNWIKAQSEKQ